MDNCQYSEVNLVIPGGSDLEINNPRNIDSYTAMPYNHDMEFIEATSFTRYVYTYLTDDEYLGLQSHLLLYPESGKIVPGSGGVRKLRWAMSGAGKRGGVRVIYYFKRQDDEIWLLTIYSKRETENIPAHILRKIAEEIQNV
jgi:hypothetical protein